MPDTLNITNIGFQKTLNSEVVCEGIGLHSGKKTSIKIIPAEVNTGISFIRQDLSANKEVKATYENVCDTKLGTTISNNVGNKVQTIEHLMAAFMGLKIDNAQVLLSGSEIPIMDGSSRIFIDLINSVGIKEQFTKKKVIKILKEVSFFQKNSSIIALPSDNFSIDYQIDFDDPAIGIQNKKVTLMGDNFDKEIGSARTFGMLNEVENMHKNGLALGGSINNAIVVDKGKILNDDGLRFEDEFVRHKILDLCGDFYLSGFQILGNIVAKCAGHDINNKFLWKLFSDDSNYQIVEENTISSIEEINFVVA